jgi:CDP-paratose 2-epimerase
MIDDITGRPSDVRFEESRFGDLRYFVCDIARARRALGWSPQVPPAEGVPELLRWIGENRALFGGAS